MVELSSYDVNLWSEVRKGSLELQGAGILSAFVLSNSCLLFFMDTILYFFFYLFLKSHNLLHRKPFVSPEFFLVFKIILFLFLNKSFSMFQCFNFLQSTALHALR